MSRRKVRPAETPMDQALITGLDADTHFGNDTRELPPLGDYKAVVVFVRFSESRRHEELPWNGFAGLGVLVDHGAFQH